MGRAFKWRAKQECWEAERERGEGGRKHTKVFLDLDSDADRLWGLHAFAKILANIVHVLLKQLVVLSRCVQLWLAQSILHAQ